jgi:thymidylate synthase ThyX
MSNYERLLELGETPQVARAAMPVNTKMNPFVFQFNFVTLMTALFPQRIWTTGAQGNTVKVAKGIFELVHNVDPELWATAYDSFGTEAREWVEVRKKLRKHNPTLYAQLMDEYGVIKSMWS